MMDRSSPPWLCSVSAKSMATEQSKPDQWQTLRRRMVDEQVHRRDVRCQSVLDAMMSVPREMFVPAGVRSAAYEDRALPIGFEQTISQPFIVGYMTEKLAIDPRARVLEIGTGTGYQTAILALLAEHVFTIERIAELQQQAAANLAKLKLTNTTMSVGDGSLGLPEHAPFDRIMATAAAPSVPTALVDQLTEGGALIIPVGGKAEQTIVRVVRGGGRTVETPLLACRFVKLYGKAGWPAKK